MALVVGATRPLEHRLGPAFLGHFALGARDSCEAFVAWKLSTPSHLMINIA